MRNYGNNECASRGFQSLLPVSLRKEHCLVSLLQERQQPRATPNAPSHSSKSKKPR